VQQLGHDSLSTWAIGNDLDERQWRSVFRQLVANGLLEADAHGALLLTDAAGPVLRGERSLHFRVEQPKQPRRKRDRAASGADQEFDLAPEALIRFNALRTWRANTAREQNVPAYVIFHDSTLRAIATNAPEDMDELARIPGIGASKLDRSGEAALQHLFDAA
jgi:ATP-dependent DNA helicase RecQ